MKKLVFAFFYLLGLSAQAGDTITVKGSDTMVILNQRWAETYMKTHPDIIVQVTGGGSGTGISALIAGSTDICAASRNMKQKEIDTLTERQGSGGVEISVAKDGVAVYLNEANPIERISLPQLRALFTGAVERWSDVGGPDRRAILYSRENNSGTYVFFKEHVLKNDDFSDFALTLPGTAGVVNAVSKDPWGIGYGGSSSKTRGVKVSAVSDTEDAEAFFPTEENILTGRYPASRDLFYYVLSDSPGPVKDFIDWVLGDEGQRVVVKAGYFPVRKVEVPK